jgi:hypothetical protein
MGPTDEKAKMKGMRSTPVKRKKVLAASS